MGNRVAKEQNVQVLLSIPASTKERWKKMCLQQGKTMTGKITELMDAACGIAPEQQDLKVPGVAEQKKLAAQSEKETLECLEAIANASLDCWPCGNLRIVRKEEHLAGKFHPKIRYVDEFGLCYDEDMRCWEANGSYNPQKNTGAGLLRWMRTIVPALLEGWEPQEPMTDLTLQRVVYVLTQMARGVQGLSLPERLKGLQEKLQATVSKRKPQLLPEQQKRFMRGVAQV